MRHTAKIFLKMISILIPLVSCSLFEKREIFFSNELLTQAEVFPREWSWQAPFSYANSDTERSPSAVPVDQDSMVFLGYYRFNRSLTDPKTTTPELFRQQISYLKRHSFQFVGLPQIQHDSARPSVRIPKVAILFEGWSESLPEAWIDLQKENIPVLIFINSTEMGLQASKEFFESIKKNSLVSFGLKAPSLPTKVDSETKKLEAFWGQPITAFSYPINEVSGFRKEIERLGFKTAFNHFSGAVSTASDKLFLSRFPINNNYGQIKGQTKNGFEIRAFSLPLNLRLQDAPQKFEKEILSFEINKRVHDPRSLHCFYNDIEIPRIARLAKHSNFSASMKNWGHRFELSLKKPSQDSVVQKEQEHPILRCTLLGHSAEGERPPRYYWGSVPIPN